MLLSASRLPTLTAAMCLAWCPPCPYPPELSLSALPCLGHTGGLVATCWTGSRGPGTCWGAPARLGWERRVSGEQGRSRDREGSGGGRSRAVASHQAEDCSRHAQAPRRFCVREFCRRRDPCDGGRAARGERPRVTSAAGRIITTWPGHCFALLPGDLRGRGGAGGWGRRVSSSIPARPSPLRKVKWEKPFPQRGGSRRNHHLGLQFLPFEMEGRSFLVLNSGCPVF